MELVTRIQTSDDLGAMDLTGWAGVLVAVLAVLVVGGLVIAFQVGAIARRDSEKK